VVRLAQSRPGRSAEENFSYGMALAHLQRWPEARAALLLGERQCPRDKRFPVELAGVAFQRKQYPEAAAWLRRGLKLDPGDDYANNFAGTVYYLMGNPDAALHYWNRVRKPQIAALQLDSGLHVQRLLLDRAFAFSPAALLKQQQFETTEARLRGLGIFPTWNIALAARPNGSFDADFHAVERNGFGAPLQALVSTFSGLPYETIYPSYFNLRREAMNIQSLLRWDAQKRRAWISVSAPLANLPRRRWQLSTDDRDENWAIRRASSGNAPLLGALNLQTQSATASVTDFASGRFTWSMGADLSHRSYRNVTSGSALTPGLLLSGTGLKFIASAEYKLIDRPQRRFTLTTGAASESGRLWSSPRHGFEKLQGSLLAHWFPQAQSDTWELQQRLRAGTIAGTPPFDELFMLGVERDNPLWLRGHIGTRDGRKGSAPLGDSYFLSNNDFYRRVYSNGLLTIQAGPLLDIGRMGAPTSGLSSAQWFFDSGIEAKFSVLGTNVVVTWGRDLRSGNNGFFGTAVP
jgi:tetratricopeptide (TPR) repeat protein